MGETPLLASLIRFMVLVLACMLIAGISYVIIFFTFKPQVFFISEGVLLFTLLIGATIGSTMGVIDFVTSEARRVKEIPTSGVILVFEPSAEFGTYWDVTGTRPVREIAWGTLEPGETGNAVFYLKNEAGQPIWCIISWKEVSWQPEGASQFFDLTWDFGDYYLAAGRARKVTLQLHVHDDIFNVATFSFDIVITSQDEPFSYPSEHASEPSV